MFSANGVAGALVVTVPGAVSTIDVLQNARVRVIESAHPRPDARSLMAGMAVVEFVAGPAAKRAACSG